MRNIIVLVLSVVLVLALGACARKEEFDPGTPIEDPQHTVVDEPENPVEPDEQEYITVPFKIVDGAETGNLVLAGGSGSADVYTMNANNYPIYLDGKPADVSVLEDGMTAEILYSGMAMETYPATLCDVQSISVYSMGSEKNPGGTYYDLAGVYIKAVTDIWQPDSGLNEGVEVVSICFENAPAEFTESEQAAVIYVLGNELGFPFETLTLSYDELIAEGYLAPYGDLENSYWFENGVLLTVSVAAPGGEDTTVFGLRTLQFNVTKWRSPLGAYMIFENKAVWPQRGTWTYTEGVHAIS